MRSFFLLLFATLSYLSQAQCTSGCDRINPTDASLNVAVNEVVCITASKVFGSIQVAQGYAPFGNKGGELRVCGETTILTATASFSVFPDQAGYYNGGVVKLFNCGRIIQSGSFNDYGDVAIQAYCGDCGSTDYTIDTAVNVTGSKILTGWECTVALPVELTAFDVYKSNDNDVQLVWQTASEVNNDRFEIEYSEDGENWYLLSVVQGAGNSVEKNTYSVIDYDVQSLVRYYRLKQVDFDGSTEYSEIKIVKFNADQRILINLTSASQMKVDVVAQGEIKMNIVDVNGKLIKAVRFFNSSDQKVAQLTFEKELFSTGLYFMTMENGGELFSQKFVITK